MKIFAPSFCFFESKKVKKIVLLSFESVFKVQKLVPQICWRHKWPGLTGPRLLFILCPTGGAQQPLFILVLPLQADDSNRLLLGHGRQVWSRGVKGALKWWDEGGRIPQMLFLFYVFGQIKLLQNKSSSNNHCSTFIFCSHLKCTPFNL